MDNGRTEGRTLQNHNAVIKKRKERFTMLFTGIHAVLGIANINIFDCSPNKYDEVHHYARAYPRRGF